MTANSPPPNPRRVAAGRLNRRKHKGFTPEGRERLREAALKNRPWRHATGPRTPQGKARAAANGKLRKARPVREVVGLLEGLARLTGAMALGRRLARGSRP
jgi:hypothetical protein